MDDPVARTRKHLDGMEAEAESMIENCPPGYGHARGYLDNPFLALADVQAKRRILDHHERWAKTLSEGPPEGWSESSATAYRMAMEWTVTALAEAYGLSDG